MLRRRGVRNICAEESLIFKFDGAAWFQLKARIISIERTVGNSVKNEDELIVELYDLSVKGADVRFALFESLGGNNNSVSIHRNPPFDDIRFTCDSWCKTAKLIQNTYCDKYTRMSQLSQG